MNNSKRKSIKMNRKWKEEKKTIKHSPEIFDDEEIGTSSPDKIRLKSSNATCNSKSLTGHSTPIQNKIKTDSSDSPELIYNESPIEPLTQNPPNEVGWDYQRPLSKEDDGKIADSVDINRTPKRSILLSKKRNSNSPLLYKPLKKKLIEEEQKEVMAGFMAELRAIEMKAKEIGEKNIENPQKTDNEVESQLVIEMDSQPSDNSDIKLQVSANSDESPGHCKISLTDKKYALLDDSIEDIMVMCSQEVEAKEFGIQSTQNILPPYNTSREKNFSRTSLNLSSDKAVTNQSKENVQPTKDTSSKNSSSSKTESGSLEIPDDSLDEFFVGIDDKDFMKNSNSEILIDSINKSVKLHNKPSTKAITSTVTIGDKTKHSVQNKFFPSKSGNNTSQTKNIIFGANCNYVDQSYTKKVPIQNKIVNSNANFGYLNKNYEKGSSNSVILSNQHLYDKYNDTRLFKAKSFSDSNFSHQSNATNFGRSSSNLNINVMLQQKAHSNPVFPNSGSNHYSSKSLTENKSWRRAQSASSITNSNSNNISQQACVNKLTSTEGSQLSTPEEIERKRQEAIMKREAKLKMKLNSQSIKRPIEHPVKR